MGLDIPSTSTVSDGNQHVSSGDLQSDPLTRLQQSAGLQDKISPLTKGADSAAPDNPSGLLDKAHALFDKVPPGVKDVLLAANPELFPLTLCLKGAEYLGKMFPGDGTDKKDAAPTDKERADAEKTLEGGMSKLIPEADRATMKAMTTALTNGDSKAFAEAVKRCGGDPKKLKDLVDEVDKMLEAKHCSTRLDVTSDGKVLVSDTGRSTGLAFDPKTGAVEAKSVEHNWDGTTLVKPGELLHLDTDKAFKEMGDLAVNGVNGKLDFGITMHGPIIIEHGHGNPWQGPLMGPLEPTYRNPDPGISDKPRFPFPSDNPMFE